MKYSNKREVINNNIFMLLLIIGSVSILLLGEILSDIFHTKLINIYSNILIVVIISLSILRLIKKNKIIEYDVSGEVLSIKTYQWFRKYSKSKRPTFEMPRKNIKNIEIIRFYLWRYVLITFLNEEEKNIKIRINISSFSEKQAHRMHIELATFLISAKKNEKEL